MTVSIFQASDMYLAIILHYENIVCTLQYWFYDVPLLSGTCRPP